MISSTGVENDEREGKTVQCVPSTELRRATQLRAWWAQGEQRKDTTAALAFLALTYHTPGTESWVC